MNVFNKVTLESLKKNRTRTIVTIIGIMLSAAMICASTTLVSSMQNFVLRCAIHIDGDWYGAVYDAAYKDYEDIRDSDRVSSAAYAQVLGYAKIDSANERKPYLYVLGGDVASGYFETMPVHLILGALPKDSTEIILPEHLTSNGKVNYKLGDTVTLDVGDRTLDGRRLGQDTPVYTYDSETQVEIMSGERLENTEPRTYTVVGIYERPTFEDYSAPGYTALTAADTNSADQAPIHCYFKLHKPAGVYDFMKEMGYTQEYRYAYNTKVLLYSGTAPFDSFLTAFYSLAAIISALSVCGAGSLIYNAFSISVSERTRQFGLLSSVGATRKQLRRMVLFEALAVSIVGIPLGILVGIGGIGMSALARFFLHEGREVAGYDRTRSALTEALAAEGAAIHYTDDTAAIPAPFREREGTVVVYTPAVPDDHSELSWFRDHGFTVEKRSQMLGHLSAGKYVMAVAGTHGKTTTSTMVAWLNRALTGGGSAFLGGISKNFGGNLVLGDGPRLAVEADEFDRSFLRLRPDVAVVTAVDAAHLDIYGTHEAVKEAFAQFIERIRPGGAQVLKAGVDVALRNDAVTVYRYAYDTPCDFYARDVRLIEGGHYRYDLVTPSGVIADCTLGIPGWVNVENAVAAVAAMWCAARAEGGTLDTERLRRALAAFEGVKRRFEFYVNTPRQVYMDDYAHHPRELAAALTSVRRMFPGRRVTAVFQPHLYTRTRDFYREFAEALSQADEVLLLPIYPAREEPIEGIASEIIAERVTVPCRIVGREALAATLGAAATDVVVSFGAGNIDACCDAVADVLRKKA